MNPVVHFEMPAEDKNRMVKFYSTVFGWQAQQLGPEMGEYVVVTTAESDETGRPKMGGAINGGFYQKTEDPVSNHPSVVIAVDDINDAIKKIKNAGGKVLNEPIEIPGVGSFSSFIDPEGNRLSILQPLQM
jgi:predicted enzyme related to lactoylglutathione lyase